MSCDRPNACVHYFGEYTPSGKPLYKLLGTYECFLNDKSILTDVSSSRCEVIPVPCGKCVGCKLDYSRKWADRMCLEMLSNGGKGLFVTLTYNDENLPFLDDGVIPPYYATLYPDDVTKFLKRLRYFKGQFRYYLSAEYGSLYYRPHYHIIIFGLDLNDFPDYTLIGRNELNQPFYSSEELENIWNKGFVSISSVSWNTCAYTARYCMKKVDPHRFLPEECGAVPEYSTMSRRPGIGIPYFEENPDCIFEPYILYENGIEIPIPRIFIDKIRDEKPKEYDDIIKKRKELSNISMTNKLMTTDSDYHQIKNSNKIYRDSRITALHRNL